MRNNILLIMITCMGILICQSGCDKDTSTTDDGSYTITVSAFTLSNGIYSATGNDLVFDSEASCQTWSRTAMADNHSSSTHLHYNAADNVSYNATDTTFTWTEYGPELDQSAIETTCSNGSNGVTKTVNASSYYQDKPNVYLRITKVTEI